LPIRYIILTFDRIFLKSVKRHSKYYKNGEKIENDRNFSDFRKLSLIILKQLTVVNGRIGCEQFGDEGPECKTGVKCEFIPLRWV
jgi:hypothetical protein